MSRQDYANARDVLPSELIALIQRHYNGLLWIPPPETAVDRHDQIRYLRIGGMPLTMLSGSSSPGEQFHSVLCTSSMTDVRTCAAMNIDEYACHTGLGLAELVRRGEVSPAELARAALQVAAAVQPRINALARIFHERADVQADALPEGLLPGMRKRGKTVKSGPGLLAAA